jgi:excinuclease ABC subunit C
MLDINKLQSVPKLPGVYIWKDKLNNILYIGKAKNLNSRMNQYFSTHSVNSYMTSSLVNEILDFQYVITKDEKDALILESNLIKKHKPRYNIMLIDDKSHRFIRIKLEPNKIDVKMVRKFRKDKAAYYGPFPLKHNTTNLINLLNSVANFEYGLPIKNKEKEY